MAQGLTSFTGELGLSIGAVGLLGFAWRRRASAHVLLLVPLLLSTGGLAHATVTIDLVPVGNPGNANDPETGYGSVAYPYLISKYEITNAQWREFLNFKAAVGDPYGLYNTSMAESGGGIARSGSGTLGDPWAYYAKGNDANWDNRPVNYVSFWDAARFCNWLHNGQGKGDTETGAYRNIGNQYTFARQAGARYFIPTENEWYKAAYYDRNKGGVGLAGYWDYPMRSDRPTVPSNDLTTPDGGNNANFYQDGYTLGPPYYTTLVGEFEFSESAYGTFDQGGNLLEWNETAIHSYDRGLRGGGFGHVGPDFLMASTRYNGYPISEFIDYGFRVASVPEPGCVTLMIAGVVGLLAFAWRRTGRQLQTLSA